MNKFGLHHYMILNVFGMLKLLVDSMLSNFEWLHEVEVLLLYVAY